MKELKINPYKFKLPNIPQPRSNTLSLLEKPEKAPSNAPESVRMLEQEKGTRPLNVDAFRGRITQMQARGNMPSLEMFMNAMDSALREHPL